MMPEVDGFTVAKYMRENPSTKETPILMLTALGQIDDKVKGFDIGVDDYLVKPFEMEELKARVKALLKRNETIPKSSATKEILTVGDITLLPESYSIEINGKSVKVTPSEFEIMNLLMQNYGTMVSGSKILTDIWGYSPDDNLETVRVHIKHLREKLNNSIINGEDYQIIYKISTDLDELIWQYYKSN